VLTSLVVKCNYSLFLSSTSYTLPLKLTKLEWQNLIGCNAIWRYFHQCTFFNSASSLISTWWPYELLRWSDTSATNHVALWLCVFEKQLNMAVVLMFVSYLAFSLIAVTDEPSGIWCGLLVDHRRLFVRFFWILLKKIISTWCKAFRSYVANWLLLEWKFDGNSSLTCIIADVQSVPVFLYRWKYFKKGSTSPSQNLFEVSSLERI
jgi:hypothetical protein